MKLGSLCSGAAGLDRAVEEVFGAETVWHCEKDPAASKVLEYRYGAPNHGDLIQTDWFWTQVEPVDIIAAGWPCQPWSAAGRKLGAEDERAIWPHIAGAIRVLRPRYVVLENVPTVARVGELERVANSLAAFGYDMRWTCLSASEVGAPHKRERIFIVAQSSSAAVREPARGASAEETRPATGDRSGDHRGERAPGHGWPLEAIELLQTPSVADSVGGHISRSGARSAEMLLPGQAREMAGFRWGQYEPAIRRWESLTRPAPAPTELTQRKTHRLSPRFSEWLMGWPAGWVTDPAIGISRGDQLRIIGNGVVVAQAIAALEWLLSLEVAA